MYDIQGALRRRAMAERLEALKHAAEATEQAAAGGDPQFGPRHLAEGEAAANAANPTNPAIGGAVGAGGYTMAPLSDDLSLPQTAPAAPATGPVLPPSGPPPMSPLTPSTPSTPVAPAVPTGSVGGPGTIAREGGPGRVEGIDRVERGAPPPIRTSPAVESIALPGSPGHAEPVPAVEAGVAGPDAPPFEDEGDEDSPAVALADLLRQGGSGLFFNRNLGRP